MKIFDVIVIGGGASGMMAAGRAAERGKSVLLLEKNAKPGEKLDITGGGRCNITNAEYDPSRLLPHYKNAEQFLYSPFSRFGVHQTFEFFESRGLPLMITDKKRVFPKSERATDVTQVLHAYMKVAGVQIRTNASVIRIHRKENIFHISTKQGERFESLSCIISTGGYSHPETGSTGDGFNWLKELGHTIQKPNPSLVPLKTKESWSKKITGVSLDDIKITFFVDGVKACSKKGRLLFTHFGISGPMVLNLSKQVNELLHEGEVTATIDLFPSQDIGTLEKAVLTVFDANKNKALKNVLELFLPAGTKTGIMMILGEKLSETRVHSISKEDRRKIVTLLKALPLTITGLMGLDKAIVSDGGVPLTEINMKSFGSLVVPGLFITGDVLNIDRPSGGYSLQLCWTSGYIAGESA